MKRITYNIGKNQLSCLEHGEKSECVALFLHGIPANAEIWRETMEKLEKFGYYCIAPDLVGYGLSEIYDDNFFSLKGNAILLNKWLIDQKLQKVWLIAHDLGGAVAQLMITENPDIFERVTLSNVVTAATYPVSSVNKLIILSKLGLFYLFAKLGIFSSKKIYIQMRKIFINRKILTFNLFERIFYDGKFSTGKSSWKFQKMLKKLTNRYTLENMEKLKSISLPVHLIWAMNDKFQSWENSGTILENTFKNVRVTKINDCGHYLQLEKNDLYVKELISQ
ncbi:MAG: alpha/beta hydrolase [Leptospiraceae bacterium]|nr:alpha/beta hydrolase [Leptospiraceae bacterium]